MKKSIIKQAKTSEQAINEALTELNRSRDEVDIEILEEESTGFLGLIGSKDATVRVSYEEDVKSALSNLEKDIENTNSFAKTSEDFSKENTYKTNSKDDKKSDNLAVSSIKDDISNDDSNDNDIKVSDLSDDSNEDRKVIISSKTDQKVEDKKSSIDQFSANLLDDPSQKNDYAKAKQKSDIDKFYMAKDFLTDILNQMHFENVSVVGDLEDSIIKLDAKVDENDTGIAIGKGGSTLEAIELIVRKVVCDRRDNLKINIDINNYKKRRDEKIRELAKDTARRVKKSKKPWNLRYMNSYERRLAHEEISKFDGVSSHSEGMEPKRYVVVDYIGE